MTPDKWQEIKGMIKEKFAIEQEFKEGLKEGGGKKEVVVFRGPLGLMRLEYLEKPRILEKKTHYSRRIGSDVKVDYVYSDTEKICEMKTYLWHQEADDWQQIDTGKLGIS